MATKMTKTTKTPVRNRKTKAEIQQEFEDIQEESLTAREVSDSKSEEAARLHDDNIRKAVEPVTVETVVQKLAGLGLEISQSLSNVSTKLVEQVSLLSNVREAVALESREMERLYKIDVAATALDQLVQDYGRKKEELESEIAGQRTAWEEEQHSAERERKEQEESLRKQRQRDIEDYEYKKTLERKKAQDKYEEEIRLQDRKNQERQEALDKSWQQRESALKDREEDYTRLRKESEEFPARLKKEAETASKEASRATEARYEQQTIILKKDIEGERRVFELQVKTMEETLSRQNAQIAALEKQLSEAKQQVQDIAVKAIEGASGARALSHINQIAMEQAKNRPQS